MKMREETTAQTEEMEMGTPPPRFWRRRLLQPLIISLMITSMGVGAISVLNVSAPGWPWLTLGLVLFLVNLEAIYTTIWLRQPERLSLSHGRYRAAELIVIILLLRLYAWLITGVPLPTLDDLRLALRAPLSLFADGYFLTTLFLSLFSWALSINLATIFSSLAISKAEYRYYSQPHTTLVNWRSDKPIETDRSLLMRRFFRRWIWGGVFILICGALSTFAIADLAETDRVINVGRLGLTAEMVWAMLFYFLSGFWLLSQGRLEVMRARWLMSGRETGPSIERRWLRQSLLVLIGIACLAAFLPVGSTVPIGQVLDVLFSVLIYVAGVLFYLISLFFILFLSLFNIFQRERPQEEVEPPPNLDEVMAERAAQETAQGMSETTALVLSSAFWTILIVVAVLAVLFFIRERGIKINGRTLQQWQRTLRAWLRFWWGDVKVQARQVREQIRERWPGAVEVPEMEGKRPWQFIRVNDLSPREQIRFFYLALVRRAGEQGVNRKESETPLEYAADLSQAWPEEEENVSTLTRAFMDARYSPRPVPEEEAGLARTVWKQVRRRLRRRASGDSPAEETDDAAPPGGE
jgi:predicted membrane channel-forming protein YqfA (hemolysin III family)